MTGNKPESEGRRRHIYLIDGSSYIFRAYHALPPLTRSDGAPVGAVLGFCNMLYKLLQDTEDGDKPSHLAVVFDAGRTTFRTEAYPEYKANRPEPPEDLVPQFSLIRDAVDAFNVPQIEKENYEADDIIATYARQARDRGDLVTIVSSDKDLMQLVDDVVVMLDTMKDREIGRAAVAERFGVDPEKVGDVLALAGDTSDNIPGVPGIGVKTAADLIKEYGDLESLLARAGEIKQTKRRERLQEFADQARISRRLVTLEENVPLDQELDDLTVRQPDPEKLIRFLAEMEFKNLKAKIEARFGEATGSAPTVITPAETRYVTVASAEDLADWIGRAKAAGQVAVDCETTSLDPMAGDLVGISLSIEPGQACYIPVGHTTDGLDFSGDGPGQLPLAEAVAALTPLFEDPAVLKIGQNLKYDMLVFRRYGITLAPIDDTMLLSYALEAGLRNHGLDELSERHLDHTPIKFKDVAGSGRTQVTFDKVAIDKATEYAAEDADLAGRLHRLLKPRLVADSVVTVYETLERPMPAVLSEMEFHGIEVDRNVLSRLSGEFAQTMAGLEAEILERAGRSFNINSPKQLGEVLFDEMGLEGGRKGKTGAYGTGADVLEALAAEGHELPAKVLEWRQLSKLKSTYTDALQKEINPETGRVHTSFSLAATTTGRLSSSDPNLQNIPIRTVEGRKIRQAFIAPKGTRLMSADYSQIELRLLAHIADIEALKTAFMDGLDIHAMTASEVFGVPLENMDPTTRRQAKAINFGIIYGISPYGLGNQLGIPPKDAKAYIDSYFEKFPGIRDYMETTKKFCREHGYVTTLFGRRCYMPLINDKNPNRRAFAERAAINAPLQGTAADIIRRAMIRVNAALRGSDLGAKMLLQVHDELVFEVPEAEVDNTRERVTQIMRDATLPPVALNVPLIVEAKEGANWDEAH